MALFLLCVRHVGQKNAVLGVWLSEFGLHLKTKSLWVEFGNSCNPGPNKS